MPLTTSPCNARVDDLVYLIYYKFESRMSYLLVVC